LEVTASDRVIVGLLLCVPPLIAAVLLVRWTIRLRKSRGMLLYPAERASRLLLIRLFQQTGNLIIFSPQQVAEPNRMHPVSPHTWSVCDQCQDREAFERLPLASSAGCVEIRIRPDKPGADHGLRRGEFQPLLEVANCPVREWHFACAASSTPSRNVPEPADVAGVRRGARASRLSSGTRPRTKPSAV
jgi:hypothetical protein